MKSNEFEYDDAYSDSLDLSESSAQELSETEDIATAESVESTSDVSNSADAELQESFDAFSDRPDDESAEDEFDFSSIDRLDDSEQAENTEENSSDFEGLANPDLADSAESYETVEEDVFDSPSIDRLDDSEQAESTEENSSDFEGLADPDLADSTESYETVEEDEKAEIIKDFVDQNVTPSMLPKRNGQWEGEEGNSKWIPDEDALVTWRKGGETHTETYRDIMDRYGFDGIDYFNKEPNFKPYEDSFIQHVELESFSGERTGSGGTYTMAGEAAAKRLSQETGEEWTPQRVQDYMSAHGLTWHECADRKTVRAIPTEINAAFKHSGGISAERSVSAAAESLDDRYGFKNGFSLSREMPNGELSVEKDEMDAAIQASQEEFRNKKRAQ